MAGLVEGASLGAAFQKLFASVGEATHTVVRFSSDLNRLKATLSAIKPVIDDVESLNSLLDRPPRETESFRACLVEGDELVKKCSKVKFNFFKKFYYSKKLVKLESVVQNFFQINVAAFNYRETKRVSVVVSDLHEKVNELKMILSKSASCCSSEMTDGTSIVDVCASGC